MVNNIGIYIILNKINNKKYIGSSNNLNKRIKKHINDLIKNKHNNVYLQYSWNKYKEKNFEFIILQTCEEKYLLFHEQQWMDYFHSWDKNYGYNICKIAGNTLGVPSWAKGKRGIFSLETIKKMKENHWDCSGENNPMYDVHLCGELNGMYGKKHKESTKEKIKQKNIERGMFKGSNNVKAKLSDNKVLEIRKLHELGYSSKELAVLFNVSFCTIRDIILKRTWKHLL